LQFFPRFHRFEFFRRIRGEKGISWPESAFAIFQKYREGPACRLQSGGAERAQLGKLSSEGKRGAVRIADQALRARRSFQGQPASFANQVAVGDGIFAIVACSAIRQRHGHPLGIETYGSGDAGQAKTASVATSVHAQLFQQ
jgi:hypothetical protein